MNQDWPRQILAQYPGDAGTPPAGVLYLLRRGGGEGREGRGEGEGRKGGREGRKKKLRTEGRKRTSERSKCDVSAK